MLIRVVAVHRTLSHRSPMVAVRGWQARLGSLGLLTSGVWSRQESFLTSHLSGTESSSQVVFSSKIPYLFLNLALAFLNYPLDQN